MTTKTKKQEIVDSYYNKPQTYKEVKLTGIDISLWNLSCFMVKMFFASVISGILITGILLFIIIAVGICLAPLIIALEPTLLTLLR